MVPTARSLLLQVPPVGVALRVTVEFAQTVAVPPIAPGNELTVTFWVAKQVLGVVKVMVAVPNALPLTTPVAMPTLAIDPSLLVQLPGVAVLANVVVCPTHTVAVPVIAGGEAITVTVWETEQPVPMV
jgi:hypothetical protein